MTVNVVVHPNSRNPRLEVDLLNITHIYVREPALEGKANTAVSLVLADLYGVPKSKVTLKLGTKSKYKTFEIEAK